MKLNLFWKLFAAIGIAMVVTIVAAVYVSYEIATETLDQTSIEGREPVIQEAAAILESGGERALRNWLRDYTRDAPTGPVLLIVSEEGDELLGRAMPREIRRLLRIPGDGMGGGPGDGRGDGMGGGPGEVPNGGFGAFGGDRDDDDDRDDRNDRRPPNFRPAQLAPDLIAPDGEAYRLVFTRPLFTVFGLLAWPGTRVAVAGIAILVAALTSLLLARYISSPIARVQRASRALAAGVLETRVGEPSTNRSDEVGNLARDFDTMAERIQALITDKETLLRDVSHELRSPLARMRMALALAQRRSSDEAQADLDRIEKEAERLDDLIGQIMTLARLRTQEEPVREYLDLEQLVSEVIDDARFEHPDAEIQFHTDGAVQILGDARGLKSAVENVVRNALTYAGTDGPIEVQLSRTARGCSVRISDSGPGVSEDDLQRIFEPLFRADESRDHKTAGQGIGLAITARVMELHGGTVGAKNRAGGGLEITLELPTSA
ncbi:MAG: ATP-binding protein [Gammaproteobacteria bacterium]